MNKPTTTKRDARVAKLLDLYGPLDPEEIARYLALGWDNPPPTQEELDAMSPQEREAALDDISARPMLESEAADWVKRAKKVGRPLGSGSKLKVTMSLDADLVEWLRASGPGWQTRANDALRRTMQRR